MMAETPTASALTTRVRNQWAVLQSRWVHVPTALLRAWEQIRDELRATFNLPTRDELARLTARLDEIDSRLRALSPPAAPEKPERKNGGARKKA